MALTGIVTKVIDTKGRLSIPKRMRKRLGGTGRITAVLLKLDGCLQLYPKEQWAALQARIEALSPFSRSTRRIQRIWGMNADEVTIDAENRLTLTPDQKSYAGIRQEVVLIGAINKVELWEPQRYRVMMDESPDAEDIAEEVNGLE